MSSESDAWTLSRSKLTTWTVISLAAGILLLIFGPSVQPDWLGSALPALGSAAFSIAGALLITEYFVKPAYTRDILSIVGIERELYETGLFELRPEARVDWKSRYARSRTIKAVISEPNGFQQLHWPAIIDTARRRPVSVTILAPHSELAPAAQMAGYSVQSEYDAAVAQLCSAMEVEWKRLSDAKSLDANASLTIEPVTVAVPYAIYICDNFWSLVLNAPAADRVSGRTAMLYRANEGSSLETWLTDRLDLLDKARETPLWRSPNWSR